MTEVSGEASVHTWVCVNSKPVQFSSTLPGNDTLHELSIIHLYIHRL